MTARVQLLMSFGLTLLLVGGGALTWGMRTGQLTILGDAPGTVHANLSITSSIDLEKGATAGDRQLTATATGLGLIDGATNGTALFTLGQREIVAIDRVVPIIANQLPPGSSVTMAFAGSHDGVTFNTFSPPQPITLTAGTAAVTPIQLRFLIPADSRFLRVKLIISRTDRASQPMVAGFTMNYSQLAATTTGASDETVLVNGTPANTTTAAPLPGRPNSLVVTGSGGWLVALFGIWFAGLWLIWRTQRHKGVRSAPK